VRVDVIDPIDVDDGMKAEYGPENFVKGVRGRHAKRLLEASITVTIEPELAKLFPDSAAVNKALQTYVDLMRSNPQLFSTI
jgi:hypothetical protein